MRKTGRIGFWAAAIFLVLVTALCCAGTAFGRTDLGQRGLESYYREKEKELAGEARAFLNAEGFANSGIMLTHTIEADGSRAYTLTVHHAKIDRMDGEERQKLLDGLDSLVFDGAGFSLAHKFYIDE